MTGALRAVGAFGLFVGAFLRVALTRAPPVEATVEEAWRIGVRSLPVLLVIATFVGTNLTLQGHAAFRPLGGDRLVGLLVALAGVRELAPLISAAMVAAKAGTEMASQIAVMRIREQIDALEVLAVDPRWFLVTPRLLAILVVMPALTAIGTFTMVASAWGAAVYQVGLNGPEFLDMVASAATPWDLLYGGLKALTFGALICLVSCWFGFTSGRGPEGVGRATNGAVVTSAVACTLLNTFLSQVLYG